MFGKMSNQTLKQTADQCEETAWNPLYRAATANNVEQSIQFQKHLQEMIAISLQALNRPTKDVFFLLVEKVDHRSARLSRSFNG